MLARTISIAPEPACPEEDHMREMKFGTRLLVIGVPGCLIWVTQRAFHPPPWVLLTEVISLTVFWLVVAVVLWRSDDNERDP
jgi:hypothetical protein